MKRQYEITCHGLRDLMIYYAEKEGKGVAASKYQLNFDFFLLLN